MLNWPMPVRRLLPVLALISLAACGPKNSVEGNWKVSMPGVPGISSADMTAEFKKPDVFSFVLKAEQAGVSATFSINGAWTQSGDTLTLTGKSVSVEANNPMIKGSMESGKQRLMEEMNKASSGKLKFETPDKFTVMSSDGKVVTFERVK